MRPTIQAPYQLRLADGTAQTATLQQFIQRAYRQEFNATIPHFLPLLLGLYRADGELVGACGLHRADAGPLYLERYLDTPIEQVFAAKTGERLSRPRLIEIGNFACAESGNARILFAALCLLLCANRLDHIAFTGTRKLRNIFHRLHLSPVELAPACADKIGAEGSLWGAYYENQPQVMVGQLRGGYDTLRKTSLLLTLFDAMPTLFSPLKQVRL
ncbi:thermostable hemolysin [Pantoea sp. 1.19]|uniref:thermostable hemolysin n=1 Tax=Pantoea sp. 1.19 TaxID=1925589 RepID=UPI00094897FA|nr:thermostable hemolysin [Pantoea sp. 1.19]